MPQPIAIWNHARGVWEVPGTESLICGHSERFSATWPSSGTWDLGSAYALPTSAHHTDDSASSSLLPTPSVSDGTGGHMNRSGDRSHELLLPGVARELALLPTPAVNDMGEGKTVEAWDEWTERQKAKHGNGNEHGASLAIEAQRLLPTPRATDGTNGGPNQRGSSGDLMLPSAVAQLGTNPRFTRPNNDELWDN